MPAPPPPPLLGTYPPPQVRKGERVACLYRDADCVVTGWHGGPIPWPRVRAVGSRGGSGLWVDEALARAVRTESAAAIMYWFGVGPKAAWSWRRVLVGGPKFGTPGSRAAHSRACAAGAAALRAKEWSEAEADARAERSKRLGIRPPDRWAGRGGWTAREVALLGALPDAAVAARVGRSAEAVRAKRRRAGVPDPGRLIPAAARGTIGGRPDLR